jgi:dihydrofolate synthase
MAGINLGLARMERFVPAQPWKAIHVAGTNGKGSICNYISAMLRAKQPCLRVGQFTSPHLVWPGDSIQVDGRPLSPEAMARIRDSLHLPPAVTSFEALTLVAFRHFLDSKVDVGVIEVGLGGRLDATNVLRNKSVTVISKIGLDHQKLLGDTVEKIAREKAGIMMGGVPCVVDGSNLPGVLDVISQHARSVGAEIFFTTAQTDVSQALSREKDLEPHQIENMACAITAYQTAIQATEPASDLIPILKAVQMPGRLYNLDVSSKHPSRTKPILLDGAHNQQSAEVLGKYVDKYFRTTNQPVSWVFCVSQSEGRNPSDLMSPLLHSDDNFAAVEFGDVEGMPWVKPVGRDTIRGVAIELGLKDENVYAGPPTHDAAIAWAVEKAGEGPIVVAGSLYGVQAVLKTYGANPIGTNSESD